MRGLLQPRWKLYIEEQSRQIAELKETVAELQQAVESLRGRIRGCENSSAAANNRCERVETRVGKMEAQIALPDTFERHLPPGDEDAELPTKQKTCPTCRGRGIVAWFSSGSNPAVSCSSCNGKGYIEAIAP